MTQSGRVTQPDQMTRVLRAVAAWDLPGAPPIELPAPSEDPQFFDALASELQRTRLLGVVLAAESLGDVELSEVFHDDLVQRQQASLLWCIELEKRLLEVREWFDLAGGIEHRVIKGPAIAHLDALDPSMRTFADIDVLVASHDVDRAVRILIDHGATRPWEQRRPGWDRRFAKSVTLTFPDGIEFDLHRMLADGVHGHRIPLDELFDARHPVDTRDARFDIGGVTFEALWPEHRLLHSAYHLLLGSREPALMNLRDLAVYLNSAQLTPSRLASTIDRWRGATVLAMAIDLVTDRLGVTPDVWLEWRANHSLDPSELLLIERHRNEGSSLGRAKLDVAIELPRLRDRMAYLGALAWPTRGHLESRGLRRRDTLGPLRALAPARSKNRHRSSGRSQ